MKSQTQIIGVASGIFLSIVCAASLFALRGAFGFQYVPSGSEIEGKFKIDSATAEALGHRHTKRTLYYREPQLDYRVAEHLEFHVIDPGNADRIIYTSYCLGEADAPSCGTFLFDGSKKKKWKIVPANASLLFYPADDRRNSWSANGKYAIFRGDDSKGAHLYSLDLTTGGSVDLAKQFSAIGRRTTLWFEGWAPDGNKAAVVMATVLDPHPPERNFEDDLWSIEFNPLKARYLGSMRGETGWEKGSYQWTKEGDEYRISITPSDRIFHKAKEKLPTP